MGGDLATSLKVPVIVLGGGPAGLTAADELCRHGIACVVFEKENQVGGLARTANYRGYLFDIGGHRFFTKVRLIQKLWEETLGEDFLIRRRLSRIYYRGRFFRYPLEPLNAFWGLGPWEAFRCGLSYLKAQLWPRKPEADFATWVSNRFGRRLFEIFFKTYTEKVWGIPCEEIDAQWAAQRIRGLSLGKAIGNALRSRFGGQGQAVIKTLIHEFHYPRRGPGMMWERFAERIEQNAGKVLCQMAVEAVRWAPGRVVAVRAGGHWWAAEHYISSIALRDLILAFEPPAPEPVRLAAQGLHYRDFLTVALIYRQPDLMPDNWIYIHDPGVRVGRVQNYKNWSPEMVPDPATTCLGLEYFCNRGDDLWSRSDSDLIELGAHEMEQLGLARRADLIDGTVLRVEKAYPVYDRSYRECLPKLRAFLDQFENLQVIGRNGMHRYNNQDHSMLTGLLAARNVLGARYDLWRVNEAWDYHEEGLQLDEDELRALERTQPLVPQPRADI